MSHDLHVICRIGSEAVALSATNIESVDRIGAVTGVPGAPESVMGLVAMRSRILTLLDCAVIAGEPHDVSAQAMAILSVDGHGYGLALAAIEDVLPLTNIRPLPSPVAPRWHCLSPQLVDFQGRTLLVIDPARIVAAASTAVMSIMAA